MNQNEIDEKIKAQALKVMGETLKKARKDAKLTQKQLAERSGIDFRVISGLESGQFNPTFWTLLKLSRGLDCIITFRLDPKNPEKTD